MTCLIDLTEEDLFFLAAAGVVTSVTSHRNNKVGMLEAAGYVVAANLLQASDYGSVQRRARWYIIAVLKPVVSPLVGNIKMSSGVAEIVKGVLQAARAKRPAKMEDFVFPPGDPRIAKWLEKLKERRDRRRACAASERNEKWHGVHHSAYIAAGLQWPAPEGVGLGFVQDEWKQVFTNRELDILQFIGLSGLWRHMTAVDITQSILRMPMTLCGVGEEYEKLPCVCPSGRIFLVKQGRLLTPPELMAAQGYVDEAEDVQQHLLQFPWSLITDLCGNAFNAHTVAAVFVAAFAVAAW